MKQTPTVSRFNKTIYPKSRYTGADSIIFRLSLTIPKYRCSNTIEMAN
jgi:hypothetical protein